MTTQNINNIEPNKFGQKLQYRQWQHKLLQLFSDAKMSAPKRFSAIFADRYTQGDTPLQAWEKYLNKIFSHPGPK